VQTEHDDRPPFDADKFERQRKRTFFFCGFLLGGLLGLVFGFVWFRSPVVTGIGAAIAFGWASARWGDPAWEWLGRNASKLWWFS
jgi:hypothetical protein